MDKKEENIHHELILQIKRRIVTESVERIKQCLKQLSQKEVWFRPNDQTVSVGNLVLHLIGNVNQWLISAVGGHPDNRNRKEEFDFMGPIPNEKLVNELDALAIAISSVLDDISPNELLSIKKVQGFEESVLAILIHVTEHFSYHTGQITYYVKSKKDIDMKYYEGIDLDKK